jgi:hypothetical protein
MPRKLVPERYVRATSNRPTAATSTAAAWQTASADPTLRALLEQPASLLSEYFRERGRSRLGRIVNTANRLAETCETVVLVGPSGSTAAARTLLAASSHPFYDRMSHGGRGGRPRIVCLEPTLDNDLLQAAFDLLKATDDGHAPGDRWVSAVIEPSAATNADEQRDFETLLQALPVVKEDRLFRLGEGPESQLPVLHGSLFLDGAALFAAALVGSDTVALCKGGAWFFEDAKQASPEKCEAVEVADFLAAGPTQLVAWHHALDPLAKRFAAALREGEAPAEAQVEVVAAYEPTACRRLVSGSSSRCVHLFTDVVRRDRLTVPSPLVGAYEEFRVAETAADRPWHEIRLAKLNDQALGELCAWFAAVTVIVKSQG